jgi:hypothetical protein
MQVLAVAAALTLAVAAPAAGAPSLGSSGCPLFPADNVWHADVSRLPVHPRSGAYLYPIPPDASVEGGPVAAGDRHVLVVQCRLYELFDRSQAGCLWPARHRAGEAGASLPPMGLRLRSGVDIGGFPYQFEAVDTSGLRISPASAAARGSPRSPAAAGPAARPRARPEGAPAALLPGVGRRSLVTEPAVPGAGAAPAPSRAPADAPPDPDPTPTRRR